MNSILINSKIDIKQQNNNNIDWSQWSFKDPCQEESKEEQDKEPNDQSTNATFQISTSSNERDKQGSEKQELQNSLKQNQQNHQQISQCQQMVEEHMQKKSKQISNSQQDKKVQQFNKYLSKKIGQLQMKNHIHPTQYLLIQEIRHELKRMKNKGLQPSQLEQYPIISYSQKLEDFHSQGIENQNKSDNFTEQDCSICLSLFNFGEFIRILPCTHQFHKECIDQWLIKISSCPLCKLDLKQTQVSNKQQDVV